MSDNTGITKSYKAVKEQVDYNAIGKHMQDIRNAKGHTQSFVAENLGLDSKFYASLETGRNKISMPRLLQFVAFMETSTDTILAGAYPLMQKEKKESNSTLADFKHLLDQLSENELELMYNLCRLLVNRLK